MDNLNQALLKAKIKQKELELRVQFEKNIRLFEKVAPSIAKEYADYQPKELVIRLDENKNLNLINIKTNEYVYKENPENFAIKQLNNFLNNPLVSIIHFNTTENQTGYFHAKYTNEFIKLNEKHENRSNLTKKSPVSLMILCGCGLGYQIPKLLDHLDIHNLNIFDPHKDSFYASLYATNWAPIISYFTKPNRNLRLSIGIKPAEALTNLKLQGHDIGIHNIACTFIYQHFGSPDVTNFINLYKKEYHLSATGLGFFEDEQVSLSHTVQNLKNQTPIFTKNNYKAKLPPLFIVGNGPSLDNLAPLLRKHQNNGVIFSCGTALGALKQLGIKPDFHIEMERQRTRADWVEKDSDAEYRKGVSLICLNTVSPYTIELFDQAFVFPKANDLGEIVLHQLESFQTVSARLCNPTVTNMGLAVGTILGFKEIYFFGVDLGMKKQEKHHSQFSSYKNLDTATSDELQDYLEKRSYSIPGNFSESVWTTYVLDDSRRNFEIVLRENPDIKAYNLNDGARISNTTPLLPEDFFLHNQIDKSSALKQLEKQFTIPPNIPTNEQITKRYIEPLHTIKNNLYPPEQISCSNDLFNYMDELHNELQGLIRKHPVTTLFLRGSMNTLFALTGVYAFKNEAKIKAAYPEIKRIYQNYIDEIYQVVEGDMFKLDDHRATFEGHS